MESEISTPYPFLAQGWLSTGTDRSRQVDNVERSLSTDSYRRPASPDAVANAPVRYPFSNSHETRNLSAQI